MNRSRFRLQAAFVLVLIGLVSWPQWRVVRATSIWHARGPLDTSRLPIDQRRAQYDDNDRGPLTREPLTEDGARTAQSQDGLAYNAPDTTPGNRSTQSQMGAIGARLNAIVGRARTSLNVPVAYARLVLRNIRTGMVEARVTADQEGRFNFIDVTASGYVVELIGTDGSVVALSETVTVNNGDLKQATVHLGEASTVRALYGSVVTPTAGDAINAAAQSGIDKIAQQEITVSAR